MYWTYLRLTMNLCDTAHFTVWETEGLGSYTVEPGFERRATAPCGWSGGGMPGVAFGMGFEREKSRGDGDSWMRHP